MQLKFSLPLPRFIFHPLTVGVIAVIHVYLAYGHLAALTAGQVEWVHIWKGFGALLGAYVFAALATRRVPKPLPSNIGKNCVEDSVRVSVARRLPVSANSANE
jgi:hypothetical protein